MGFHALSEASGRRQTPTPARGTLKEMSSLHHCQIQRSTIANEASWVDEQALCKQREVAHLPGTSLMPLVITS
jgi:hypothetical protein